MPLSKGVASTKRVAKQFGAQSLLGMLHERTAKTYYAVAELYSSFGKTHTMAGESSSSLVVLPATASATRVDEYRRPVDPRLNRTASPAAGYGGTSTAAGGAGRAKKRDRRPGGYSGGGYTDYSGEAVGEYLDATATASGYSQTTRGHYGGGSGGGAGGSYPPYYGSSGAWRSEREAYSPEQHGDERERVVEYSQAPPASGYSQPQYYGGDPAASSWGYGSGYPPYVPVGASTAVGAGAAPQSYGTLSHGRYGPPAQQLYGGRPPPYGGDGRYSVPPPVDSVYRQLNVRRRADAP